MPGENRGYSVGQCGRFEVLDSTGKRQFEVEGEILRIIPVAEGTVWALIRTRQGTGVFRLA